MRSTTHERIAACQSVRDVARRPPSESAQMLAELRAIRELLERLTSGGRGVATYGAL